MKIGEFIINKIFEIMPPGKVTIILERTNGEENQQSSFSSFNIRETSYYLRRESPISDFPSNDDHDAPYSPTHDFAKSDSPSNNNYGASYSSVCDPPFSTNPDTYYQQGDLSNVKDSSLSYQPNEYMGEDQANSPSLYDTCDPFYPINRNIYPRYEPPRYNPPVYDLPKFKPSKYEPSRYEPSEFGSPSNNGRDASYSARYDSPPHTNPGTSY